MTDCSAHTHQQPRKQWPLILILSAFILQIANSRPLTHTPHGATPPHPQSPVVLDANFFYVHFDKAHRSNKK